MNPLGLTDWTVLKQEHADGAIRFLAEYTRPPAACRRCGVLNPRLYRHEVYESSDRRSALDAYDAWQSSIPADLAAAFSDLTSAATNWKSEIFAYFDHPVTNAYTEALNGMIKVTNRLGRGYSFDVIRAKMLYAGGLHANDRPIYRESWPKPEPPEQKVDDLPYLYEAVMIGYIEDENGEFATALSALIEQIQAYHPDQVMKIPR